MSEIEGRLIEWARWMEQPKLSYFPPESVTYRLLHAPGRATNSAPDGGMAAKVANMGPGIAWDSRCKEVHAAVLQMPEEYQRILTLRYSVPSREKPRSAASIATAVDRPAPTVEKILSTSKAWICGRLNIFLAAD